MLLLTALLAAGALAGADAAPMPAALAPKGVAAAVIYCADIDAEKVWYMEKLGMTVTGSIPPNNPKPFEWVLGYGKAPGATIILARSSKRPAGDNLYSRSVILVPDAKALAAWLKTQGVESREAVPGVAYMIKDPEQNTVELYSPKP